MTFWIVLSGIALIAVVGGIWLYKKYKERNAPVIAPVSEPLGAPGTEIRRFEKSLESFRDEVKKITKRGITESRYHDLVTIYDYMASFLNNKYIGLDEKNYDTSKMLMKKKDIAASARAINEDVKRSLSDIISRGTSITALKVSDDLNTSRRDLLGESVAFKALTRTYQLIINEIKTKDTKSRFSVTVVNIVKAAAELESEAEDLGYRNLVELSYSKVKDEQDIINKLEKTKLSLEKLGKELYKEFKKLLEVFPALQEGEVNET